MARRKIREYDSKRLLTEQLSLLAGMDRMIRSAQVTETTDFNGLANREPWLSSEKLVVKPDMLFGKRGKSVLVAANLDLARAAQPSLWRNAWERMLRWRDVPRVHLSIVSERVGYTISFSECGDIEIEENWDKVKTVNVPTEKLMTADACAPLIATIPFQIRISVL